MGGWHLASNILLCLGIAGLLIGVLLRFEAGRWLLVLLLIMLLIFSLLEGTGDWPATGSDTPLHRISRFLLIAGGCCVALALLIRSFHLW